MSDLRPSFVAALNAFGVAATVTLPDGDPVSTRVIWHPPITEEYPNGSDHRRATPRRRMAIPVADVPRLPRETRILAAEAPGDTVAEWRVDETERLDSEYHGVVVLPVAIP